MTLRESEGRAPITAAPRSRLSQVAKTASNPQKPMIATMIMLLRDGPAACVRSRRKIAPINAAIAKTEISDAIITSRLEKNLVIIRPYP